MNKPNLYPLKLIPVSTAKIWGGTRLAEHYGKPMPEYGETESGDGCTRIGETLELSLGKGGESIIENGECAGMGLGEYLSLIGEPESELPVMVKMIDAGQALSVQVHPRKTELWYIVEAEKDAELIYGLEDSFDRARFESALKNGDPAHLLHQEKVSAGEFYMLPSGLVHAIGEGILVAEFQQNDTETQRIYDYGRPRELHTEAALDTVERLGISKKGDGIAIPGISECEFFSVKKIDVKNSHVISSEDKPLFFICVYADEDSKLDETPLSPGDSYYLPRGCKASIVGKNVTVLTMTW